MTRSKLVLAVSLAGLVGIVGLVVADEAFDHVRTSEFLSPSEASDSLHVGIRRVTDRLNVLRFHRGVLYAFEDVFLWTSRDSGRTFQRIARLPKSGPSSPLRRLKDTIARLALVRRFRRSAGAGSLVVLESGTVVVFWDRIYRLPRDATVFEALPKSEALPKPFPSSVGVAVGPRDTVYYGEYVVNAVSHAVRIVRGTDDGRRWETAYTFAPGEVMHAHSVTWDPYRRRYWIATGDLGSSARLLFTEDGFRTVVSAGCCSPDWRTVSIVVREHDLLWGSDDDTEQPAIVRFDPARNSLRRVQVLDNPSYHAAIFADGRIAITTSYEGRSVYVYRRHPPAETAVWMSDDAEHWTRSFVLSAPVGTLRDLAHNRPQLRMPSGDPLPMLIVTPFNTASHGFQTLWIETPSPRHAPATALP